MSRWRLIERSMYFFSRSIPVNCRSPMSAAAIPVVLLPAKGSRMEAPGAVDARMTRLKSSTGFELGASHEASPSSSAW